MPLGATNSLTIPHHTPTNKQLGPTAICHSQTSQAVPTVKKAQTDHLRHKTYSKRHLPTWGAREQAMCKLTTGHEDVSSHPLGEALLHLYGAVTVLSLPNQPSSTHSDEGRGWSPQSLDLQ